MTETTHRRFPLALAWIADSMDWDYDREDHYTQFVAHLIERGDIFTALDVAAQYLGR